MAPKEIFWCGGGDLFLPSTLKTSKLYITQRTQNTKSPESTPPSHTTSHTDLQTHPSVAKLAGGVLQKEPAE